MVMNVIRVFLVYLKVIKGQWRNARKSAVANTSEVEPIIRQRKTFVARALRAAYSPRPDYRDRASSM
jgi:hypothetical protein